ncbi:MAG: DUF1846 domain-containing protein [archaeon]
MVQKKGFDSAKYYTAELAAIKERATHFDRLYLEVGGKLLNDTHAKRVLPGYDPRAKLKLMMKLKDNCELIYCISASELEEQTIWFEGNCKIEDIILENISMIKKKGIKITAIVLSRFSGQKKAKEFAGLARKKGFDVYFTKNIPGYPMDLKAIFGKKGFDAQPYIETSKRIVIVTAHGANAGKMFLCLSQIYHDNKLKLKSGYAKIETFPIWNLPLHHPVNLAYEAATADIADYVMQDPYYASAYHKKAVNYNRDVEGFKVLKRIIKIIIPKSNYMHSYKSPTDMGINMAKKGIVNDKVVFDAGLAEILHRKSEYSKDLKGKERTEVLARIEKIMKKAGLK